MNRICLQKSRSSLDEGSEEEQVYIASCFHFKNASLDLLEEIKTDFIISNHGLASKIPSLITFTDLVLDLVE